MLLTDNFTSIFYQMKAYCFRQNKILRSVPILGLWKSDSSIKKFFFKLLENAFFSKLYVFWVVDNHHCPVCGPVCCSNPSNTQKKQALASALIHKATFRVNRFRNHEFYSHLSHRPQMTPFLWSVTARAIA